MDMGCGKKELVMNKWLVIKVIKLKAIYLSARFEMRFLWACKDCHISLVQIWGIVKNELRVYKAILKDSKLADELYCTLTIGNEMLKGF